jgi:CarD family transcriptional regulator
MAFQVGDQVVHAIYGVGEVIQLDEKEIQGQTNQYYVVKVSNCTLWVPVNGNGRSSLRYPTPADEFDHLFRILKSPAEPLAADRLARKTQLSDQIKDGRLDSICRAIRDLNFYRKSKKMNENDNAAMERMQTLLLDEWSISLSVPLKQARNDLTSLLAMEGAAAD